MFARKSSDAAKQVENTFEPVGECPRCGLPVTERGSIYSCSSNVWDEEQKRPIGCGFVIHKLYAHKLITTEEVKQLLADGKTDVIGPFRSRGGKTFYASLHITDSGKLDITNVKTVD